MAAGEREGDADFLPPNTRADEAFEIASLATAAIPWIGGPMSRVLSGISFGRRIGRVRGVVDRLVEDLRDFKSGVSEKYVQTDEFQDLLEATLRRVGEEIKSKRRDLYRRFLVNAIRRPVDAYREQLSVLRVLEELHPNAFRILTALAIDPGHATSAHGVGAPIGTLNQRLNWGGHEDPIPRERIGRLVAELNARGLTNLQDLHTNMTGHGAEDLRHAITPFGHRVLDAISSKRA